MLTVAQKRRLTTDWFIIILCLGFVMRLGALGGCIDSWAVLAGRTGVQGTTTSVSTTVLGMALESQGEYRVNMSLGELLGP